ncbi:Macro domain-containing protein [Caenorhabditis elegans]|uniref:Macro domain-containing protein n=1 Tax=Caenorhabditis elegans TaxID=6239 RepID=G5EFH9_CAEEL|nr:Macro domain-containing protein [Caenorhabditis elegans]CCA65570.1 Macro domain-containing protein [Caenorhabditis elegans]|eukprot:NP_001255707.1 Uncharacterized protein CELE_F58D2.5 [Caenorhabditis elegans]
MAKSLHDIVCQKIAEFVQNGPASVVVANACLYSAVTAANNNDLLPVYRTQCKRAPLDGALDSPRIAARQSSSAGSIKDRRHAHSRSSLIPFTCVIYRSLPLFTCPINSVFSLLVYP